MLGWFLFIHFLAIEVLVSNKKNLYLIEDIDFWIKM